MKGSFKMNKLSNGFNGFSQRLKAERKKTNLTQDELSYILGFGEKYIAKLESNSNSPSLKAVITLADYFNISVDYLLFGNRIQVDEQLQILTSKLSQNEREILTQLARYLISHNHNIEMPEK